MGSHARLFLAEAPRDVEPALRGRLAELEQRWSRFVESSEINVLNARAGSPVRVSADTMLLVRRALQASQRTHGWFDPTLLKELEAAGYDRPFAMLAATSNEPLVVTIDHRAGDRAPVVHEWAAACRWISVDVNANTVMVPEGAGFDPGGIGKGLAADMVLARALSAGAQAALVDLGGDIVTGGHAPDGGWQVDIEDPFAPRASIGRVRIPWGAVATSSKAKRRWRTDDGEHHHLLDPRDGTPSTSSAAAATVIAGTCWQAESFAKAAVLAGVDAGIDLLESAGVEGVIVDAERECHLTVGMSAYFEPDCLAA